MEKRQPYSLKSFIFYYNIFQIVSNVIIVYTMWTAGWSSGEITFGCEPARKTTRPIDLRVSLERIYIINAVESNFISTIFSSEAECEFLQLKL